MWNVIIGAIAGGIGGAAYNGINSYKNAKRNADAYKKAALGYTYGMNKYSGQNANDAMIQSGQEMGRVTNDMTQSQTASQKVPNRNSVMANALSGASNVKNSNTYNSGYNVGSGNKATEMNSKFNAINQYGQNQLKQAGIDYAANTAKQQAGLGAMSGAVDVAKNVVSDERVKEYNNHEGLPKADVDDALRKIESIEYKYKPETGLDDEEHVGTTAQSWEGTAFDDVVNDTKPYKSLDKQMLLEATMAGIASLRKELDELEKKDVPSDECLKCTYPESSKTGRKISRDE